MTTKNRPATEVVRRETYEPAGTEIRGFGPRALLSRVRARIAALDLVDMLFRLVGAGLASAGLSHFVAPRLFGWISRPVFPEDTGKWVKVNGAAETGIGLALLDRRTRLAGVAGALVYVAYLGERAVTAIRTQLDPPKAVVRQRDAHDVADRDEAVTDSSAPKSAAE